MSLVESPDKHLAMRSRGNVARGASLECGEKGPFCSSYKLESVLNGNKIWVFRKAQEFVWAAMTQYVRGSPPRFYNF
jgi:hypothetical protein